MKKSLAVILSVLILGMASAPVFAQKPSITPAAMSKKAKKTHKKKMKKTKSSATPRAK
jgi:hypothetical protein